MSSSTTRGYSKGLAHYWEYAREHGLLQAGRLTAPAQDHLAGFVTWLGRRGVGPSSVERHLRGVGRWCLGTLGHDPRLGPDGKLTFGLSRVLEGLVNTHSAQQPLREALTADRLRLLLAALRRAGDIAPPDRAMLEAALLLGVYGLCRAGEITHRKVRQLDARGPRRGDVSIYRAADGRATHFEYLIRQSKTDTAGRGQTIKVFATGDTFCPVRAMDRYLQLFKLSTAHHAQPLFRRWDGGLLTRDRVNQVIKGLSLKAGFDPRRYSTHSMRAGGATTLSLLGVAPYVIKQLGRWSSDAYTAYIRLPDHQLRGLHRDMGAMGPLALDRSRQASRANSAWDALKRKLVCTA